MSEAWPARHRNPAPRGIGWALAALGWLLLAGSAAAQPRALLLYAGEPPTDEPALRRALPRALSTATRDPLALARTRPGVRPERLAALSRVEALLSSARQRGAALDEAGAVADLASAAELSAGLGDVPGAAGYNAEVQLQLGVTAAQAGLEALATIALRRAASLDPGRRLRTGEAPPAVVELSQRLAREVSSGPVGELSVEVAAEGAQIYLDDAPRGSPPARLRLTVGPHVLRVEAPGHVPYGALIEVLEGERPTISVALSPEPALAAARALQLAARRADYRALPAAIGALADGGVPIEALHVVEHRQADGRALWVRCDAESCRAPVRLTLAAPRAPVLPSAARLTQAELARARTWLRRGAPPAVAKADSGSQGYLWVAAGAVVAALATGAVLLAPEPDRQLRVVVDPSGIDR